MPLVREMEVAAGLDPAAVPDPLEGLSQRETVIERDWSGDLPVAELAL
jgi:hypothetical protein